MNAEISTSTVCRLNWGLYFERCCIPSSCGGARLCLGGAWCWPQAAACGQASGGQGQQADAEKGPRGAEAPRGVSPATHTETGTHDGYRSEAVQGDSHMLRPYDWAMRVTDGCKCKGRSSLLPRSCRWHRDCASRFRRGRRWCVRWARVVWRWWALVLTPHHAAQPQGPRTPATQTHQSDAGVRHRILSRISGRVI